MRHKNHIVIALLLLIALPALAQVTPEQADAWYEIAIRWVMRPGLAAVLVGVVMAFAVPQWVKMQLPAEWDTAHRKRVTQATSFGTGFVSTALLWPLFWSFEDVRGMDIYGIFVSGLLAAVLVGVSTPITYPLIMNFLYKRGWANEETWSGEARAAAKRGGDGGNGQA